MQGEPAHLQRLSVEGGAQDTQHARAEACPAKHIYPSDCVGSDVWMAQQVRPTLPDPAYRTDRQQVVNVLRRKSAESIKAGGQSALHLTGRIYLLYVSTQLLWWYTVTGTMMVESGQLIAH